MTTKRALLLLITILACVCLVEAQSPTNPPSASPEASASPAKKRGRKKAETSPATSPEASASPAKTRGRKKAETSPAPMASPEASPSPAKTRGRKKAEASAPPAASPTASPAKPLFGNLFKPKNTPAPAPATESASTQINATPAPGGGHGMVWVNTDSHVYHKGGSRYYGKTKQGKYMSEADAIKEGDRPAKKE
jgi:membrane protein involved in colicin uptake